ncbi:MAG: UDP-4-amino-4,6-dideoxy-N-acetyl-beta-L-altrosamine transaminase [Muribaculaceae bacterium]|nr:UDP-4-amino-4,6-dideoxy-N-acetyl-beta-L-altrosamine transaminase [Muribaculaceae bacterium]
MKIPYGRQHITDEDIAAVTETLRSDFLTQGPKVTEFEEAFAKYVDAPYAVSVNNATAGLHLAAKALGVKPGQKVIVTPLTFAASANCIRYCGGDVDFCDIDPDTYLMDLDKLEQKLQAALAGTYAGVVVVDFAGYPHDMERVRSIADRYGLWIIEDACHAPGAWWTDSKDVRQLTGNSRHADCTVFSFHPVKHIATGEGGMVTTANPEILEKLRLYRTHGITRDPDKLTHCDGGWYYEMQDLGFNYRLTDIQAALGISQLKRADAGIMRRQQIAEKYDKAFAGIPQIRTPHRAENLLHAFHLYVIQVPDRKEVYDRLREAGVLAQVHYAPLHLMPYYRQFGWAEGSLPVVEDYYANCLSLPMFPTLTDEEQNYVIETLKKCFA